MNKELQNRIINKRAELFEKRKQVFSLPPEKALDAILNDPQPMPLVHSFPEEDFYFLIHEIGLEDSICLLSLASNRQWDYILDIEAWEKDRVEIKSVTLWLNLLLNADPDRFTRWLLDQHLEFFEFCLSKKIQVIIREHDQDPSDFGSDFFTYDGMFYVRLIDYLHDIKSDENDDEYQNKILSILLKHLADYDHVTYQKILLETGTVIAAESEEEAYRLRNFRLAEKGFLPFDEAIGIYQPLKSKQLEKHHAKVIADRTDVEAFIHLPLYPSGMLKEENLFTSALRLIQTEKILHQIQAEFAGMCNQIIAADQKKIRDRESLKNIVKKACGYISIGLERLTLKDKKSDTNLNIVGSSELIQNFPLSHIFRVGYGLALELKWNADKWRKTSWFAKQKLSLSFWSEEWLGVLGGLLIKKPLFYDNYKNGVLYREFCLLDDIKQTEKTLDEIIAFDNLLSLMNIRIAPFSDSFLTYKNLVLTLWARDYLGLAKDQEGLKKVVPLALDEFKQFYKKLWSGNNRSRTSTSMKESFLEWLSSTTGLTIYEISLDLGETLENLFNEIENKYGKVLKNDLDPRYIDLFLVKN